MSERQSLCELGSKAQQIVDNVLTTSTYNLQQTQRLQYSRQYNLQVLASVQSTKSAVKLSTAYTRGVNVNHFYNGFVEYKNNC